MAVKSRDVKSKAEKERYQAKQKMRDTKGTFHAKMGSIKDNNGMDQIEAEDIKKTGQEYTRTVQKRSSQPR